MNPQRLSACAVWLGAWLCCGPAETAAQRHFLASSNAVPVRLTLESREVADDRPTRVWSRDLNLFLARNPDGDGRLRVRHAIKSPVTGQASVATVATNGEAVFQDRWADADALRMERILDKMEAQGLGITDLGRPSAFERGIETVFMPEPIRLGKATFGFSPYTAIKRRNPLCLLNPIPIILSW